MFVCRESARLWFWSEAGWAASVWKRGRLRLRSWCEAGSAASVLERGRLGGFVFGARTRGPRQARARPAPGPRQGFTGKIKVQKVRCSPPPMGGLAFFLGKNSDLGWRRLGRLVRLPLQSTCSATRTISSQAVIPIAECRNYAWLQSFIIFPSPGQRDTPLENFGTNRRTFRDRSPKILPRGQPPAARAWQAGGFLCLDSSGPGRLSG